MFFLWISLVFGQPIQPQDYQILLSRHVAIQKKDFWFHPIQIEFDETQENRVILKAKTSQTGSEILTFQSVRNFEESRFELDLLESPPELTESEVKGIRIYLRKDQDTSPYLIQAITFFALDPANKKKTSETFFLTTWKFSERLRSCEQKLI